MDGKSFAEGGAAVPGEGGTEDHVDSWNACDDRGPDRKYVVSHARGDAGGGEKIVYAV